MLPLLTREESRQVDQDAIDRLGIESLVLMENAGRGATDAVCARFPDRLGRVVLVGGPGQNGGDAWVVARRLHLLGHEPVAILVGDPSRLRGDAKANWSLLTALGLETCALAPGDAAELSRMLAQATLIVEGLFGTGLDRPIEGGYRDAVIAIDRGSAPVVSLDLPSGVDANTGGVLGVAPRAALTTTFAGLKRGLHQYPGAGLAGEIRLVDIGIPAPRPGNASLWSAGDLNRLLEPRRADGFKGTNGHLLVVAGSPGKTGAALLAGSGAFRAGAGLVTLAARSDTRASLEQKVIELMTLELPDEVGQATVEELCEDKQAVVLGPGLGLDELGRRWTEAFAVHAPITVVIDADGLSHLAELGLDALQSAAAPRILTPHPGEAARLLSISSSAVQRDRYAAASLLCRRSGQIAILKGARSIVASKDHLRVCVEGTPALGVAGTGDVLSGILGAFAMTLAAEDAGIAGTLVHALGGARAAIGDRGLIASEVAEAVPHIIADALTSQERSPASEETR